METKFIIVVGKTCTGKDTLVRNLKNIFPLSIVELKNCTTRPKRTQNEDTYIFLTHEEFTKKFFNDEFIEVKDYNNWFYGTLKSEIVKGKINLTSLAIERVNLFYDYLKATNQLENTLIIFLDSSEKVRLNRYVNRLIMDEQIELKHFKEMVRRFETEEKDYIMNELEDFPNVVFLDTSKEDYQEKYNKLIKEICKLQEEV